MTARFAVYLVPPAASALWGQACRWLGRDPGLPGRIDQPQVPGLAAEALREITREAARYGFHGTLKAPFRLADGVDASVLAVRVERLAREHAGFRMPRLAVDVLDGFIALRPAAEVPELAALADGVVAGLDDLRAPLTDEERERRRPSMLGEHQRALLERWGYPYVFEEFRFHMTLTRRLKPAEDEKLRPWLRQWFDAALRALPAGADLGVFEQPAAGGDFVLRRRFALEA
ncbi:MAG TPA: DUF1045 domain-containing protein [Burkholderiales bacterium]|nr:DUF1045 domain-containing protein [Burkholderiales bacterium]